MVIIDLTYVRPVISIVAVASVEEVGITYTRCGLLSRKLSSRGARSTILPENKLVIILIHLSDVVLQQLFRGLLVLRSLCLLLIKSMAWLGRRHEGWGIN